jgi:hypothetical protein
MRAVIRFGADWTPEIVLIDPTAVSAWTHEGRLRKMTRGQLAPLLARLREDLGDTGRGRAALPPHGR